MRRTTRTPTHARRDSIHPATDDLCPIILADAAGFRNVRCVEPHGLTPWNLLARRCSARRHPAPLDPELVVEGPNAVFLSPFISGLTPGAFWCGGSPF